MGETRDEGGQQRPYEDILGELEVLLAALDARDIALARPSFRHVSAGTRPLIIEVLGAADPKAPLLFEDFELEHEVRHVRFGCLEVLSWFLAGGAALGVTGHRDFRYQPIGSPATFRTGLFAWATLRLLGWWFRRRGRRAIIIALATLLRPVLTIALGRRIVVCLGVGFVRGLAGPFEGGVRRRGPRAIARILLQAFEELDGRLAQVPGGVEQPLRVEGLEVRAIHLGEIIFCEP
jgi:hypothetical protein